MARLRAQRQSGDEPDYRKLGLEVYGHLATDPASFPWDGLPWEPIRIGPTWRTTDDGRWLLPEHTIGWAVLGWSEAWLNHGPSPWRYTDEQARFLLWWYAIDGDGRFLFRDGVLQRLKGWGKDPLGACLCFIEAFGPARFDRWDGDVPVARDVPDAWVQTAATAQEQTKNTTRFFPTLAGRAKPPTPIREHYGLQIGKTIIHGLGDTRLVEAVTSSPTTLEGARATFVLKNETQHWDDSNEGREMADVIERNATKSPDGAARSLAITNAYEPSNESVAQDDREAYEKVQAGGAIDVGLLYDSLEAPPDAPLDVDHCGDVVLAIRGDSHWLDVPAIRKSILDIRNPASRSRRFWYNQITAVEDATFTPQQWDAAADTALELQPNDIITLGFDGSIANDHSALIACHVDLDHLVPLGIWEPDKKTGEVDRRAINRAVRAAFEMYDVVGFYSDLHPFESYVDEWADDLSDDVIVKATMRQPFAWDMRTKVRQFTEACERFVDAILESGNVPKGQPRLTHDGSRKFRAHALNARRAPNDYGISVRKEARESPRKIDAIPAAILARLARMDYVALPPSRRRKQRTGVVW